MRDHREIHLAARLAYPGLAVTVRGDEVEIEGEGPLTSESVAAMLGAWEKAGRPEPDAELADQLLTVDMLRAVLEEIGNRPAEIDTAFEKAGLVKARP